METATQMLIAQKVWNAFNAASVRNNYKYLAAIRTAILGMTPTSASTLPMSNF